MAVDGAYMALEILSPRERFLRTLTGYVRAEEQFLVPIVFVVHLPLIPV